jgi:hypothetical protein
LTKDLKLKSGEKVFRYVNRTTAIGGMTPFIKINLEKGLLYFPVHSDNDDVMFETRGVNPLWINIIEDKMAKGGGVEYYKNSTIRKGTFGDDDFNPMDLPVTYRVYDENGKVLGKTTSANNAVYLRHKLGLNYKTKIVATDKSGNERVTQDGVNSKGEQYAGGGGVDMNDWDMPVIRTQFEDEEYEYAEGGETGEPHRTMINGMMAKGGAIQHGLKVGDKIVADQFWENTIVVENGKTNKRAVVYLETGKRKEA